MIRRSNRLTSGQRRIHGCREASEPDADSESYEDVLSENSVTPHPIDSSQKDQIEVSVGASNGDLKAVQSLDRRYYSHMDVVDAIENIIASTDAKLVQDAFDRKLASCWELPVDKVNIDIQLCSKDQESVELAYAILNTSLSPEKGDIYDSAHTLHAQIVCSATAKMLELCCTNLEPDTVEYECVFPRISGFFFVRFRERLKTRVNIVSESRSKARAIQKGKGVRLNGRREGSKNGDESQLLGIFAKTRDLQTAKETHLFVETHATPVFAVSSSEIYHTSSSKFAKDDKDAQHTNMPQIGAGRHHGLLSPPIQSRSSSHKRQQGHKKSQSSSMMPVQLFRESSPREVFPARELCSQRSVRAAELMAQTWATTTQTSSTSIASASADTAAPSSTSTSSPTLLPNPFPRRDNVKGKIDQSSTTSYDLNEAEINRIKEVFAEKNISSMLPSAVQFEKVLLHEHAEKRREHHHQSIHGHHHKGRHHNSDKKQDSHHYEDNKGFKTKSKVEKQIHSHETSKFVSEEARLIFEKLKSNAEKDREASVLRSLRTPPDVPLQQCLSNLPTQGDAYSRDLLISMAPASFSS